MGLTSRRDNVGNRDTPFLGHSRTGSPDSGISLSGLCQRPAVPLINLERIEPLPQQIPELEQCFPTIHLTVHRSQMPKYKFLVSSGTVPEPADKSVRSHAIRTALRNKPKAGAFDGDTSHTRPASSQQDSRLTVEAKASLNGRFRVSFRTRKAPKARLGQQSQAAGGNEERNAGEHCSPLGNFPFPSGQEGVQSIVATKDVSVVGVFDNSWEAQSMLPLSIGGGLLDPFHSIPVDYCPRVDRLLKYCKSNFDNTSMWL
jgi:hypothetical protein